MSGIRIARLAPGLVLILAVSLPSFAGDPPYSCTVAAGLGCEMTSDLVVFAEGDPEYEVTGTITDCFHCTPPDGNGNFAIDADLSIEFGPYTNPDCDPALDTVQLELSTTWLSPGAGSGGEATYVPMDSGETFIPTLPDALRTRCVDSALLDYRISWFDLAGSRGARTGTVASGNNTVLRLPTNVRSSAGMYNDIGIHRFTQDLSFHRQDSHDETSTLRYWPDGMPFRIGPSTVDYREDSVAIDTAPVPMTPPPYEVVPPDPANLDSYQPIECEDPEDPYGPCTWHVWNAGFLDSNHWIPRSVFFDASGMDLRLELPDLEVITYQPLSPYGTWVRLEGPAAIDLYNSRIAEGGTFDTGTLWLRTMFVGPCQDLQYTREFQLLGGANQPRVTNDGGILAGIEDLNPPDGVGTPQPIEWTVNTAYDLGCGTFWAPPPWNPVHGGGTAFIGPQREWVRSANNDDFPTLLSDPSIDDRGIYAGLNYNRNRVCVGGDNHNQRCRYDEDCPGTPPGTCQELWSPLCPAQDPGLTPTWTLEFQKPDPEPPGYTPEVFPIPAGDFEKEMVFHVRHSGVTGVFDAGLVDFTIGDTNDPNDEEFDLSFNQFGHAFLASHSEWSDTIIRGGLGLPVPSDTIIPFTDMTMCDCGSAKSASTGEPPTENWLEYWSAKFYPHQIRFSPDPPAGNTCKEPSATACADSAGSSKTVCIDASTPIPHFSPDADASWSIGTDGRPGEIVPLKDPVYEFEHMHPNQGAYPPYTYHAERFRLSDWTDQSVPDDPYGFYNAEGQIELPYFGLPEASIRVRRNQTDPVDQRTYVVDMVEKGHMDDPPTVSHIVAERSIAADLIPLSYKIDYFPPEETADPDDGESNQEGRGLMLGYSWNGADPNLDLGSIPVPAAVMMNPDWIISDLGPPASVRLYGATTAPDGRMHLDEIMPSDNLFWGSQYNTALSIFGEYLPYQLPDPAWNDGADYLAYIDQWHNRGAIGLFAGHPDYERWYRTSNDPSDPGMRARPVLGYLKFSPDLEMVDLAYVDADIDTNGNFFAFNRGNLTVDRHVKTSSPEQPIAQLGRKEQADNMAIPGNMSVPFPNVPNVPGLQWDFDYTVTPGTPPAFQFESLTGTLDLTKGGLSGIGFDKAGLTLKYWNDGDWYFQAGLKLNFNGYGAYGDILLGNTKDMTPLQALDPVVADFLCGIHSFNGGYARVGVQGRIFDYGCLFRVSAGFEVGGWYITDSYGGKLRGWVSGKGACIVSVRGDLTLLGGSVGDRFKMTGAMWVAGGIGFCDEEDWDTPEDVLDDDFCAACVLSGSITGITPPKFKLSMDGPDADCSM